jgi:CheY-like chemotaxis protein
MEALGTLAGGVAHDLNNILSGLVSYPELILMDLPKDSTVRKAISTIQKSGEKAAAIVQDLLTLARRGVPVMDAVNLNKIISEYLNSHELEKLLSYHPEVKLETSLDQGLFNMIGSDIHLFKTVMNLVSNAAEAMPEGGTMTLSTENRYVDELTKGYENVKEGDYVTLKLVDNGIGLSPEDQEKIFEPFYTKKKMGRSGTGLGMSVVWGTVKDHNGIIDIKSEEGKGTTFTIFFPVSNRDIAIKNLSVSPKDYMGKGEKILIVDDVKEQRKIASELLARLGYNPATVPSGEEAVGYIMSNTVDLILLDMIMDTGIDGLDTYRQILKFKPEQKAIITSGFSETERIKEAQKLGAGAYIKKPYVMETIGVAIREELDR